MDNKGTKRLETDRLILRQFRIEDAKDMYNNWVTDIGYCMGKAWWGNGIMPEALRAVIEYLFEEVGLNRVAACHDVNNPKSGRVMQKAGMSKEGVLRAAGRNNQGICDEVWYSIIKNEFVR